MSKAFFALFCVLSAAHLVFSLMKNKKGRAYTKPFLVPLLLISYLTCGRAVSLPLALALSACWLGDVLLIPKGKLWFALGGIAFAAAHGLLITAFQDGARGAVSALPIIEAVFLGGIALLVTLSVKDGIPEGLLFPIGAYLALNGVMNAFALNRYLTLGGRGALLVLIGAALFFLSDCLLFPVRFHKNRSLVPGGHFSVMLGYLAGLSLITAGFAL